MASGHHRRAHWSTDANAIADQLNSDTNFKRHTPRRSTRTVAWSSSPRPATPGDHRGRRPHAAGTNAAAGASAGGFTSTDLGRRGLDLTTQAGASTAITSIDAAIKSVSTARADLGALQNRFEHTIKSVNVTVENLSASESRIRDTDMASEMVNFTRGQILSQAGTAMLAQANQIPQGVLSLLRG